MGNYNKISPNFLQTLPWVLEIFNSPNHALRMTRKASRILSRQSDITFTST